MSVDGATFEPELGSAPAVPPSAVPLSALPRAAGRRAAAATEDGSPVDDVSPDADERVLDAIWLELPYIPEFLLDDVRYWFSPALDGAKAVYHELAGESAKQWTAYYTKRGWNFLHRDADSSESAEGPYRIRPGGLHFDVLSPGRFFAPKPQIRLDQDGPPIPLVSLEKHKPINPWKPNYVQALNFVKKYEWPHDLPRRVVLAMWEIEECGQVAGSTSWRNGERVLLESDSRELRETLADFFYNRPEDYELGSQVCLRVLGKLGPEGFGAVIEQASHPITRKRRHVARSLGELRDRRGIETLLLLADDEDFGVRDQALQALARVGVDANSDPDGKVARYAESPEIKHRVWAAAARLSGGDEEQRKFLVELVKDEPRPLSDLGELGQIVADLEILDAVPFLIKRFKSGSEDIAMDAAETLAHMTGLAFDYSMLDDAEQKRAAVKTLERWWDERKRERREQKSD